MPLHNDLLKYLKRNRDEWVSGEMISRNLSVSRSAIWKHIGKLKEEGYLIESSPKKGYLYSGNTDLILEAELKDGLSTDVFGKQEIIYYHTIDSTNTKAKDVASSGAPEGTIVIANAQTNGRGRRGRYWLSPPGKGLYVSMILRPKIPPGNAPIITLMTAVALIEAIHSLTEVDCRVKWPNDILVDGKKLAGILTEISTDMDAVDYIIVGFGINVHVSSSELSSELSRDVTSILQESGKKFARKDIFQACLKQFEKYYSIFKENRTEHIIQKWKEYTGIIGRQVNVDVLGEEYSGEVLDIGPDGVLILKCVDDIKRLFSGDITRIKQKS